MADEIQNDPTDLTPTIEQDAGAAEAEAPVAGSEPSAEETKDSELPVTEQSEGETAAPAAEDGAAAPTAEPAAETPADASPVADEPTAAEPNVEASAGEQKADEEAKDGSALGTPGAEAPAPEEGKAGEVIADQPSAPTAAATSGSVTPPASGGAAADTTVDDKDQAIFQPVQGDTSINVGAGGKSVQVGEEHVAVGYDGQVFNAAAASQSARGVPWEVFVKLEGLALEQAAAINSLVREKHCGHHKSEKEWRQICSDFYNSDEG